MSCAILSGHVFFTAWTQSRLFFNAVRSSEVASASGSKQACECHQPMSTFGGKADMAIALRNVRFTPKSGHATIRSADHGG